MSASPVDRAVEVALTIPDNEARTALGVLRRLDVPVARLRRADVYVFACDDPSVDVAAATRASETLFNGGKHALRERESAPRAGEVWIDDGRVTEAPDGTLRLSGRRLAGVRAMRRYVSWTLAGDDGSPASPALVDLALERLLCNPAFQKAIR